MKTQDNLSIQVFDIDKMEYLYCTTFKELQKHFNSWHRHNYKVKMIFKGVILISYTIEKGLHYDELLHNLKAKVHLLKESYEEENELCY